MLGRDSVTINSGGEKIFAEEVEQRRRPPPRGRDVVVSGERASAGARRWSRWSSCRTAPRRPQSDVVEHAAQHVARYKLPKDVLFRDAIQRSPSGKADYRWAKAQVQGADA